MPAVVAAGGRRIELRDDVLAAHESAAPQDVAPVRLVYAAAHVVLQESYREVGHSVERPGAQDEVAAHIDWPATMQLRRELDGLGFAIAEAMDTAQRFQLGWAGAKRLIEECGALQLPNGFVAGAGTDHLDVVADREVLIEGVAWQVATIQAAGGEAILLPMSQLVEWGASCDDYVAVYRAIVERCEGPLYVHWLGEMFLPALRGYFPGDSFEQVMALDPDKVRGAKLSMLDADLELRLRQVLAGNGQIMLTGDDFNFGALMDGPAPTGTTAVGGRSVPTGDFSHGLLGIFDGIARPASVALRCLAAGDRERYLAIMRPCEELSRVVFGAPTQFYKSGLAFLSWLNGAQDNPMLVNHEEHMRDRDHYLRVVELASAAGVLRDAELAAVRLQEYLENES